MRHPAEALGRVAAHTVIQIGYGRNVPPLLIAHRRRPRQARSRAWLAGFMALVLMCWQMSLAAYACPLMGSGQVAMTADTPFDMPCMETMADDDESLATVNGSCQQHCQFGATSQVADPVKLVLPLATAWPPNLASALQPASPPAWTTRHPDALAVSMRPPPPHSLLHCCFRI